MCNMLAEPVLFMHVFSENTNTLMSSCIDCQFQSLKRRLTFNRNEKLNVSILIIMIIVLVFSEIQLMFAVILKSVLN